MKGNNNKNPDIITPDIRVFFRNSQKMKEIKDGEAQLVVTSPPYWNLKDYSKDKEQIGNIESTYQEYLKEVCRVWKECYRILSEDGKLVINIGKATTRTKEFGRRIETPMFSDFVQQCCWKIGFDFWDMIIWQKRGNYKVNNKYIFGSYPYPPNFIMAATAFEYILVFKKGGKRSRKPTKKEKHLSKLTQDEWRKYTTPVWIFSPASQQSGHPAVFPEELPKRIIKLYSFVGDLVVDPFLGSGTTLKVCKKLKRKGIGYEINKNYKPLIMAKVFN